MAKSTAQSVLQVRGGESSRVDDLVVTEAPMEIRLGTTPIAVLMRTPGDDDDLVRGFALTEAIVLRPDEMAGVRRIGEDTADARYELTLAPGVTINPEQFRRNLYTTSSCGVCGKASIDAVRIAAPTPPPGPVIDEDVLLSLPGRMREAQETFSATGGIHAAAAFSPDGSMLALREDVGRHNAVDKVVGALSRDGWPPGEVLLLVSGRVSFEMVQKAAVAGIPVVGGVSAASSLAVELAQELGMTVVGFLRDDGYNVYSGEARISRR